MKKDKLLESAILAINKWGEACVARGEEPVCISCFGCAGKLDDAIYRVFGERAAVVGMLLSTNGLLDPDGGKASLLSGNKGSDMGKNKLLKDKLLVNDELLGSAIVAIDEWKEACRARGENPVCISHFVTSRNPKDTDGEDPKSTYAIFGDFDDMQDLLVRANKHINPDDGDVSHLNNSGEMTYGTAIRRPDGSPMGS